jgi:hypothetical protein
VAIFLTSYLDIARHDSSRLLSSMDPLISGWQLQRSSRDVISSCPKLNTESFWLERFWNMGISPQCNANLRNAEVRNLVVKEFLGKVNKLITHNEAGAVLNDIYRDIATPSQRTEILQEIYGPEFRLFKA